MEVSQDALRTARPTTSMSYERLSVPDRSFLVFEDSNAHMHLGGLTILEAGPLTRRGGGIDVDRIRAHIGSRLHQAPRYRQRLAHVPLFGQPVWVDDHHFNLCYHVRHTAVPYPGDDDKLKALAARIMSQRLDRSKPLWELWVIEGLQGGRLAMLVKTHHSLADGISAFDLFATLLGTEPTEQIEDPEPWVPRPMPRVWSVLRDQIARQAVAPFGLAWKIARAVQDPARLQERLSESLRAVWSLAGAGLGFPAQTPLNGQIGPHRRFDWLALDLSKVKDVKHQLGGTVNDVVLTTVAGAVRRFLVRRGVDVDQLNYRIIVPVSVRKPEERGTVNNRASGWLTALPVKEPNPWRRYELVRQATTRLKTTKQALGPEVLSQAAEYAAPGFLTLGVRLTAMLHPYNLIVTNVPGPPMPLYFLGARLLAGYPQVPLFENQGLGVALFSYDNKLQWGFNADWELVPDLSHFVEAVAVSFEELHRAAMAGVPEQPTPAASASA